MNSFSRQLKNLRKTKKVLQKDIATQLGIVVRSYQRYEYGDQEPNIDSLITIADYFDISLDYLVGRPDKPKVNKRKRKVETFLQNVSCPCCKSTRYGELTLGKDEYYVLSIIKNGLPQPKDYLKVTVCGCVDCGFLGLTNFGIRTGDKPSPV